MDIRKLPLESLQAIWGNFIGQMDPRHLGEMIRALESKGSLVGYSPLLQNLEPVYREMMDKYDKT